MTENGVGYDQVGESLERASCALEDLSVLIGEQKTEQVRLSNGITLVPGIGLNNEADHLYDKANALRKGIFKVIVIGKFSNGKSTFLNAIMEEETLPVKMVPTTAVITSLVYGNSSKVLVFKRDEGEPQAMEWEKFVAEYKIKTEDEECIKRKGFAERFANVKYAQIERPHRFLKNGVMLIDTPGLEEDISRENLTRSYLKQANAVIILLDVTHLLDINEKALIKQILSQDRQTINNVFFIINKMDVIDREETQEIHARISTHLKDYFIDENGQFNEELYDRRIFYISAKNAMIGRDKNDSKKVTESNIVLFENELERFLTKDEKVKAIFNDVVSKSRREVKVAHKQIDSLKRAADKTLEELKSGREKSEALLKRLEQKKREIDSRILMNGNLIANDMYNDLCSFVGNMLKSTSWENDSSDLLRLDEFNIVDLVLGSNVEELINKNMNRYIRNKIGQWDDTKNAQIQERYRKLKGELDLLISDFNIELLKSKEIFIDDKYTISPHDIEIFYEAENIDIWGAIKGIDLFNVNGFSNKLMQRVLEGILALGSAGGILGLITGGPSRAALAAIVGSILALADKEKIRSYLIDVVHKCLSESMPKLLIDSRNMIIDTINKQFCKSAEDITETLQKDIDQIRKNQERFINEKESEHFSANLEKERLDKIDNLLNELFSQLESVARMGPLV